MVQVQNPLSSLKIAALEKELPIPEYESERIKAFQKSKLRRGS